MCGGGSGRSHRNERMTERAKVLSELEGELRRTQQLIDDFRSDWRQRVSGADLATSLEPLHAHNREILRLMAALTLGEGGETRLSKVLRD